MQEEAQRQDFGESTSRTSSSSTNQRIRSVAQISKRYPIPVFAIAALVAGAIIQLVFGEPSIARWVWYGALIIGGLPIIWGTFRGILRGKFASDVVAMLAIIAAILMDQAFAGVVVVLMQSGGEAIEDYGLRRATSSLDALLARAPRLARRKNPNGSIDIINVNQVRVGDHLVVRPGDLVPVDGEIISGKSEIDESALTGEPIPRAKSNGDKVLSGAINLNGGLEIRADKISQDSEYARIVELVKKAQEEKPPIQRLADQYAVYFTPITLAVSAIGFLITFNPVTILAVLVVATPCPLILATPIAVISGVNKAAKRGIIVKGGAAIEQMGRTRVVAFDKTGTITFGAPFVEKVVAINNFTTEEILLKAGCVGQLSSHVAAQSIAHKAAKQFAKLELPLEFKETPGAGVEGVIQQQTILVGSKRFLEARLGKELVGKQLQDVIEDTQSYGKMLTFVAIDSKPAGVIVFNDQLRAGVPSMIQRLHDLGVEETVMLTGDNFENAQTIAREAGIQVVEANLLPGQKVEKLQKLKEKYERLMMVGDGINDAPALATATVGVAMGAHGAGISAEAADVVLLVDDITAVSDAVSISQRMLKVAKQGIFIGLGSSFALMVIAAFGFIPPAIGAMLQEVIDASVILNALRAR
ncbi:MAG: heavy metal translocating P-type ATPase [Nitrososphaerota archaeon]|nr:heavy metal translocating P-type ATPase [Nitrososphaerota archaeon]